MRVNPFGRPRHKKPAFLRFLENQEIFRNFGILRKKWDFGRGFLEDLEQKIVLYSLPFYLKFLWNENFVPHFTILGELAWSTDPFECLLFNN